VKQLFISVNSSGIEVVEKFRNLINNDYKNYDQIIVSLTEPGIEYSEYNTHHSFIDLIKENIDKNIIYYGCNYSNTSKKLPLHFINYMFHCGPALYKTNTACINLLEHCIPFYKKSKNIKKWDFLMGGGTATKDWLFENIKSHDVFKEIFLTYYRDDVKTGHWSNFVKIPKNHTAETIYDRFKSQLRYSDLIDPDIYNQTFYTALIETAMHEDFCVFTEKTAKPIIAKRPFVVFGSPGQLKALQQLGFKTFSPIIDESYDLEVDSELRFKKVLDSMHELNNRDPLDVYENLKEILEHNKKHFEETDWNSTFLNSIKNCNKKIDLNNFTY
tara:strand:- start:61 stop:1047 length:987 start_codon:yes stop_codon:yes gene_type:complete